MQNLSRQLTITSQVISGSSYNSATKKREGSDDAKGSPGLPPSQTSQQPKNAKYTNQSLACRMLNTGSAGKKSELVGQKYTINCAGAKAVKAVLDLMIVQNPCWKETTKTNSDIMYLGHTAKDEEIYQILAQNKKTIINRYPNVKPLARKDTFQNMMAAASDVNPVDFDFVPRTFVFPQDENLFHEYQKNHRDAIFIAKPQNGKKGEHIVLFQDLRQVPAFTSKEMVVQRYIGNPMLINDFKFDLRVYVVVTGIKDGQITAFIANEGLARFCTDKYKKPSRDNFKNIHMHLTNYAVNKSANGFVDEAEVKDILEPNNCSKRTLTALYKELEQLNDFQLVQTIKNNIKMTCAGTLGILANMMQLNADPINPHNSKNNHVFAGSCYQILGFDILLDSKGKAWLLEINDHPSMNPYVCATDERGCKHEDCPISIVDMHVKKQVQFDTMDLFVQNRGLDLAQIDEWRSLTQILPFEDKNHQNLYETFQDLRHMFLNLSKGQLFLTVHEYERRLHSNSYISKHCGMGRIDLHLVFQKVTRTQKQIDFLQFYFLIKYLKAKCEEKSGNSCGLNVQEFIDFLGFK